MSEQTIPHGPATRGVQPRTHYSATNEDICTGVSGETVKFTFDMSQYTLPAASTLMRAVVDSLGDVGLDLWKLRGQARLHDGRFRNGETGELPVRCWYFNLERRGGQTWGCRDSYGLHRRMRHAGLQLPCVQLSPVPTIRQNSRLRIERRAGWCGIKTLPRTVMRASACGNHGRQHCQTAKSCQSQPACPVKRPSSHTLDRPPMRSPVYTRAGCWVKDNRTFRLACWPT